MKLFIDIFYPITFTITLLLLERSFCRGKKWVDYCRYRTFYNTVYPQHCFIMDLPHTLFHDYIDFFSMFIITNPRQIPLNIWSSLKSVSGSHFWPSFITCPVTYIPNITHTKICVFILKDFGSGYWIRFHLERKVCFRSASVEKLYGFLNISWTCG